MYRGSIYYKDGLYHIDWGTTIPFTPRIRLNTKKDAERLLSFMNDKIFWADYKPDMVKLSKRYGVYASEFADELTLEEYNKWMFHFSECEEYEGGSYDDYINEYRDLLDEMFERWSDNQILV